MIRLLSCLLALTPLLNADPLTVMCWNVHHGRGVDGKVDIERIAKRIRSEKPDLVALQEVDRNCDRSGKVDQSAEMGRLTGLTPVFGKAIDLGEGEYGLAILSRFPVLSHQVHRLPGAGESRIALEVVVEVSGRRLSFVSTHLDHQQEERRLLQARALAGRLAETERVILCGDFNDVPASPVMKSFPAPWKRIGTVPPTQGPSIEIDHVLLKGLEPDGPVRVIEDKVSSDHRPLVGRVR